MEYVHIKFDGGSLTFELSTIKKLTKKQLDEMGIHENAKAALWKEHENRTKKTADEPANVSTGEDS